MEALVLPVWTYPPVLLGDRGQSPQGGLTFIASAAQWPVVVVPMGFVGEQLPMGMQFLGRPWSEGLLIRFAYAYEQLTHHRRVREQLGDAAEGNMVPAIGLYHQQLAHAPPGAVSRGKLHQAPKLFSIADGVIVGTSLKVDGVTWNPVDPERARRLVDAAGQARSALPVG